MHGVGLAPDSPYQAYYGTGLGLKLRMHPLAATLIVKRMEDIDQRNASTRSQVRQINDRICELPGLSEPVCRSDQERVYYWTNVIFLDEKKAGMSRARKPRSVRSPQRRRPTARLRYGRALVSGRYRPVL